MASSSHTRPSKQISTELMVAGTLDSKLDVLSFLQYRARNEPPYDFEWVDHIDARLRYSAALGRIASWYETRFGAVHSGMFPYPISWIRRHV